MKKVLLIIFAFLLLGFLVLVLWRKYHNPAPGQWTITNNAGDKEVPWIAFRWGGDTLGHRYFDKAAIFVPVRFEGIADSFSCQLDLGSNLSQFYETPLQQVCAIHPSLQEHLSTFSDHLFGGQKLKCLKNAHLILGNTNVNTPTLLIREQYGNTLQGNMPSIGTLGVDIMRDRILIMDYPHQRFCIVDELPENYNTRMSNIEINQYGFIIIPSVIGGKVYKIMYDSGSSIFALITSPEKVNSFSLEKDSDTLVINSWGTKKQVVGRAMADSLSFGDHKYGGFNIYSMEGLGSFLADSKIDAMTGNALFWNNLVIFDFKHKKIGIL